MKTDFQKTRWLPFCWMVLCLYSLVVTGCAWLIQPPGMDPVAQQLVERLQQTNGGLNRYKMLSKAQLELEQVVQSVSSMAIAADRPDRMRVEILSPAGQPVTSMAADGKTIQIRPQGTVHIYRFRQSATALEDLIHIPLGVAQLQGILIGQPELPTYVGVEVATRTDQLTTVVLKNRWNLTLAVLKFDTNDRFIQHLEMFDEDGKSRYRATWLQWQKSGPYRIPSKLFIENNNGYRLTLRMRRFWPDVALPAATFDLTSLD